MSVHGRVLHQTILLTAAQLAALGIGFLATVLVSRALGPEGRGVFAWIMTLVGLGVQVATVAGGSVLRVVAAEHKDNPALLPTLIALGSIGTILGLPLLAFGLWHLTQDEGPGVLVAAWLIVPFAAAGVALATLNQIEASAGPTLAYFVAPKLAQLLIILPLWWHGYLGIMAAVAANIVSVALQFVVAAYLCRPPPALPSVALMKQIARLLGVAWIASLAVFAIPRLSLLVLGAEGLLGEAGHYSVALTLFEIMMVLPVTASGVLTTQLTRGEWGAFRRGAARLVIAMAVLALIAALAAALLIPMLFGRAFEPAVPVFRTLLGAVLLATCYYAVQGQLLLQQGKRAVALPPLIGAVLAGVSGVVLVPPFGVTGALASTLAGFGALVLTSLLPAFRRRMSGS